MSIEAVEQIPGQLDLFEVQDAEALPDKPAPHNGTTESLEAAHAVGKATGRRRRNQVVILRAIRDGGGVTDEQIQEATGLSGNTERPRRIELREYGYLSWTTDGETRAGNRAKRWWLTHEGMRVVGLFDGRDL